MGTDESIDKDETYLKLLFSGEFKPGQRIVETQLAQKLGLSRVPVREAIAKLVAQGTLLGSRYGGVWIRQYKAEEIQHLYEMREAIEASAARLAAIRGTQFDFDRLGYIMESIEKSIDKKTFATSTSAEIDIKFHKAVVEISKNERFAPLFNSLIAESKFVFYNDPMQKALKKMGLDEVEPKPANYLATHKNIYDAIISRDGDRAEKAMKDHIREAADRKVRIKHLVDNMLP